MSATPKLRHLWRVSMSAPKDSTLDWAVHVVASSPQEAMATALRTRVLHMEGSFVVRGMPVEFALDGDQAGAAT